MGGIIDIVVIGIIIVGAYYAFSSGLLTEAIENVTSSLKDLSIPMPGLPAGPGGGGGGAISTSGTCTGTALTPANRSDREQFNGTGLTMDAYEVTWCGTIGDQGEDLTFKMYGPKHSNDGDCCWCVMHVDKSGKMTPGGEGPHPDSNCEHPGGGSAGVAPCYKAVMRPGPIQEGYALIGGAWKKVAEYKGPCGCSQKSSKKTGDTLMVRCDGPLTTKCASWKPLGGGTAQAAYARRHYYNRRPRSNFDRIGIH